MYVYRINLKFIIIVIKKEYKFILCYFAIIINIDILLYPDIYETKEICYIYRFVHLHYYVGSIGDPLARY